MQAIKLELLELLRRNDLMRSVLLLGKIQDVGLDVECHAEKLLEMAARVWHGSSRARNDAILKAQNINQVLFHDFGLQARSERYKQVIDDPNRYYLHIVLEKRVTSPLTATIFYLILAEQVGLNCQCIAFPSYYLLKVSDIANDFYIDPFDSGKFLCEEEFQRKFRAIMNRNRVMQANLYERVTAYQLVARLAQQLKHIYILKGNALQALRAVELLTGLYPQSPELTRDRGILYCEMEYFSKAMEDLKYYLKQRPNAEDVGEIKKLTSMLRGYREIMN